MKKEDREIVESPLYQGEDEEVIYRLTTTPWGSSPTNVAVAIYLVDDVDYTDYTTICISGSTATIAGDIITLPMVSGIVRGNRYQLEVRFDSGGNTFETFSVVHGQK